MNDKVLFTCFLDCTDGCLLYPTPLLKVVLKVPIGELQYTVTRSHTPVKVSSILVACAPALRCFYKIKFNKIKTF